MAKKTVKHEKVERIQEVSITEKVNLILFETGTIQLAYAKGGGVRCSLSDDMIDAIMTVKFKQELDKMRVSAMDLRAAKGARNPAVAKTPVVNPVDIQAIIQAELAKALGALMAKQA